ncbi:MAG: sirohydrochlorin cobaltochelatase [Bacillota bacterium]|nr:sirohydrochlorin cobaltochelatase [Bacillota bacterium]
MKLNKMMKKLLATFVAVTVLFSYSGISAFAVDGDVQAETEDAVTTEEITLDVDEEAISEIEEETDLQAADANEGEQEIAFKVTKVGKVMMTIEKATQIGNRALKIQMSSTSFSKMVPSLVTDNTTYVQPGEVAGVNITDGKAKTTFEIPLDKIQSGENTVWSFYSTKNKEWYNRSIKVDLDGCALSFSDYVPDSEFYGMTLEDAKSEIDEKISPAMVDQLIKLIQVQTRNENTDKMCELAKYAWDKLGEKDEALLEEVDEYDYFGLDTGDASKDNILNTAPDKKKEILVVSFGTSFNDSRAQDIGGIEKAIEKAYGKDYSVRRAFTAQIIINHVQSRDGFKIDNVDQAMEKAVQAGVKDLVVQPTHLMRGAEYDELVGTINKYKKNFNSVYYAQPLLGSVGSKTSTVNTDKKNVMSIIAKAAAKDAGKSESTLKKGGDTAFVFMGHGTSHSASISYSQMQSAAKELGYNNVFIGTVEGEPAGTSVEAIIAKLNKVGYKKVVIRPLMVVAGDHANNDMAGDEDSWKEALENAGYSVIPQIKGLGSVRSIQSIYVAHTKAAIDAKIAADNKPKIDAVKATKIISVKASNKKTKKAIISWKKNSKVDGYQVYRGNKSGKSFKKVATTKSLKATIKGQKKGSTYTFKVRGYKKINGKTYYTKFSKVVKIKIKK